MAAKSKMAAKIQISQPVLSWFGSIWISIRPDLEVMHTNFDPNQLKTGWDIWIWRGVSHLGFGGHLGFGHLGFWISIRPDLEVVQAHFDPNCWKTGWDIWIWRGPSIVDRQTNNKQQTGLCSSRLSSPKLGLGCVFGWVASWAAV